MKNCKIIYLEGNIFILKSDAYQLQTTMPSYITESTTATALCGTDGKQFGPPSMVTEFMENFNNHEEYRRLSPSYSYFRPSSSHKALLRRVLETPDTYTFFTGNGLSYSFYLYNSPVQGLVLVFHSDSECWWYKVTTESIERLLR